MVDTYYKHRVMFIIAIICMCLSIVLLGFSLYIFPHLFFNWNYDVPNLLRDLSAWYQYQYNMSYSKVPWAIFLPFFIIGIVFALITKYLNNVLEKDDITPEPATKVKTKTALESFRLMSKIALLAALGLLLLFLLEKLINIDMLLWFT